MQELRLFSSASAGRCLAIFSRDQDYSISVTVLEPALREVLEDLANHDFEQKKRDGTLLRIARASPMFFFALATYCAQELGLRIALYHGVCQSVDSDLIMLPLPVPLVKK